MRGAMKVEEQVTILSRGAEEILPEGGLLDRLRSLPAAYAKANRISATEPELARMQKWAAPTAVRPMPTSVTRSC